MKKWFVIFTVLFLTGCTMSEQGTVVGGTLGAGTGAIIGNQTGHKAEGALIGGVVGAITGHAIGKANEKTQTPSRELVKCPNCGTWLDTTGMPKGSQVRCPNCNTVFVK